MKILFKNLEITTSVKGDFEYDTELIAHTEKKMEAVGPIIAELGSKFITALMVDQKPTADPSGAARTTTSAGPVTDFHTVTATTPRKTAATAKKRPTRKRSR